jgi:hypothetical protein
MGKMEKNEIKKRGLSIGLLNQKDPVLVFGGDARLCPALICLFLIALDDFSL